jgi:diguanylate cyclase (GGDEF)-like protein
MTSPIDRILAREADLLKTREATGTRNGRTVAIAAGAALGGSLVLLLAAFASVGLEQHRRQRSERALEQSTIDLQTALREANRSSETLRRLSTLAELLQNCRDLDEAINVIERALPPLLPDVSGALALINASRNIVEARMHWGVRGSDLGGAIFAPDDCWALRRSQPHPGDDDHTAPVCPHLTQTGVTADHTLCLPLNSQGQVLGVLSLCAPVVIAPDTRRLATTAADQLALALANLQLQASLRTQSIRDPLTNLFNRRYLEASLPRELLRAERRKGGLSVLMFDLDHFKRYNDTQGHDAGDALLSAFGALLAQSCRGEDMPCRFGGEEFTLVLTDADHAQARERADAIRKATAELVVHYRAGTLPAATVSIGVATYPEHGDTPEALLRMADQALYRAKQLGRNVVGSANDLARTQPAQAGA